MQVVLLAGSAPNRSASTARRSCRPSRHIQSPRRSAFASGQRGAAKRRRRGETEGSHAAAHLDGYYKCRVVREASPCPRRYVLATPQAVVQSLPPGVAVEQNASCPISAMPRLPSARTRLVSLRTSGCAAPATRPIAGPGVLASSTRRFLKSCLPLPAAVDARRVDRSPLVDRIMTSITFPLAFYLAAVSSPG